MVLTANGTCDCSTRHGASEPLRTTTAPRSPQALGVGGGSLKIKTGVSQPNGYDWLPVIRVLLTLDNGLTTWLLLPIKPVDLKN